MPGIDSRFEVRRARRSSLQSNFDRATATQTARRLFIRQIRKFDPKNFQEIERFIDDPIRIFLKNFFAILEAPCDGDGAHARVPRRLNIDLGIADERDAIRRRAESFGKLQRNARRRFLVCFRQITPPFDEVLLQIQMRDDSIDKRIGLVGQNSHRDAGAI